MRVPRTNDNGWGTALKNLGIVFVLLLFAFQCRAEKLPPGFNREPNCSPDVRMVCVADMLYLEPNDLIEIRRVAETETKSAPPATTRMDPVMHNIVLVSVHKPHYFGVKVLLEKLEGKGWIIIRKEHAIY